MRKIVIINHYGNTPEEPGATRHYELADFFSQKTNKKVELWVCGYNHYLGRTHKTLRGLRLFSKQKIKKFNFIRIKSLPYRKSNILRQLNITLFDLLTSFKILFSRNVDLIILSVPPISIFNVLAIKFRRIKLIVDVEDLWPLFLLDMGLKNKLAIKYMEQSSRFIYNIADGIDAVSEGMLNYVKNEIMDQNKPMWLSPLGVNGDIYFNSEKDKKLIKDKSWRDDFIIMYIGAHNPANDLFSVLDTIFEIGQRKKNINRKISFVFFGDGNQLEALKSYKNKMNLDNVFFEGPVPANVVHEYLKLSDICLTNLKKIESFKLVRPNKLFQYMALSKPIICGIWGESKEIIEKANSGIYVDFTNSKEASEKILTLVNNQNLLKEYSENGKKYVLKNGIREKIFNEFVLNSNQILQK